MGYDSQQRWGYEESISCPFEAFSYAAFAFSGSLASLKALATAEKVFLYHSQTSMVTPIMFYTSSNSLHNITCIQLKKK